MPLQNPPFTVADAEALGYALVPDDTGVSWYKGEDLKGHAEGDTPIFSALCNIAEAEGQGFVQGYLGPDQDPDDYPNVTDDLILAVSGEVNTPE